ncbi:MAG: hypothetical protein MJK04_32250 [Psychrosphaera sp.]|nr:hypothetical protein [Psychrosphaera sp.]
MNILKYLFAETVSSDSDEFIYDENLIGSRDAIATENDIVRSAVKYDVGPTTFETLVHDVLSVGSTVQTFH